ncbi:MAG TPA: hypothetical protein VFD64_17145 [Gemmatimonadaceae bacterium]|nr:hypothetical protein [Gemmatimonadaceae bacterium]
MTRLTTVSAMSFAALAAAGFTVAATDDRIEKRVDARIRATVASIADSLDREGVPHEPLVDYALEGTQKGGSPQVILTGVRKWARDLRRARQLLGPNAKEDEVSAGAQAIRAGVDERHLTRIRESRKERQFASALSTMTHIINRGVPADTAATVLINVALASASDAEIKTLQDEIERDISGGTPPGMSAVAREQGLLDAISAGRGGADGVAPGTALPSTRGTARPADPLANPNLRGSAVGNKGDAARPPAPRGKDTKRP